MPDIATIPPSGPPPLLRRALAEPGQSVKDQLDGIRDVVAVRRAFEERSDEPLSAEDLDQLDELIRGFLLPDEETAHPAREVGAGPFSVSTGSPDSAGADTLSAYIGVPGTPGPADVRTTSPAVEAGTEGSVPDEQAAPLRRPAASAMPE